MSHSIHTNRVIRVKGVGVGLGISHGVEYTRDTMDHNPVIGDGDGHRRWGIYHAMECAINNTYSASLNQSLYPPIPLPCPVSSSTLPNYHILQPHRSTLQTTPSPQNLITFPSDRPILHPGDSLDGTQSECERSKLELTYSSVKARFLKRNLNVPYHLPCLPHRAHTVYRALKY